MDSSFNYITEQYEAVLSSRQVLFEYCKTILSQTYSLKIVPSEEVAVSEIC